jgi:hypothetical protein
MAGRKAQKVTSAPERHPGGSGTPLWGECTAGTSLKVSGQQGTFRLMGVREEAGGTVLSVFGPYDAYGNAKSGMWRSFREEQVTPVKRRRSGQ